jgi:CRP-like cAMP-binding protein
METLFKILNSIYPLTTDSQILLHSMIAYKKLKKREHLLLHGEICSEICFIERGLLHCYYSEGKKKITSWFMKEGDVTISVNSFYTQTPSYESIQALEDTELYYITYQQLYQCYKSSFEINYIGRELTQSYYSLKDQHCFHLQKGRAKEKLEWFEQNFQDIILRAPFRYVATYLGVRWETLSRARNRKKR